MKNLVKKFGSSENFDQISPSKFKVFHSEYNKGSNSKYNDTPYIFTKL